MKILQIKGLSVNSISLDYSFWLKVRQTFLNMFIAGNRVMVCSESSFVGSDVEFFIQDSGILFHWSVATRFQYTFDETFTAKFNFFYRWHHSNSMSYYTDITSPYIWTLHWRGGSFLIMLFVFYTTCSGEKIATASAVKLSTQSLCRNLCHSAHNFCSIQSSSYFSARAR